MLALKGTHCSGPRTIASFLTRTARAHRAGATALFVALYFVGTAVRSFAKLALNE